MSFMEGLNTELPAQDIDAPSGKRSRDLWWTIYTLDRQLSSSPGVPISVQDYDISTSLGDVRETSQEESALKFKVRLSQVLSTIVKGESAEHNLHEIRSYLTH